MVIESLFRLLCRYGGELMEGGVRIGVFIKVGDMGNMGCFKG